jgi:hypothetical protein
MAIILLLVASIERTNLVSLTPTAYTKLSTTKWRYSLSQICTHPPPSKRKNPYNATRTTDV